MNAETTPRLGTLPVAFPATVAALHRVAEQVVAPARKPDNEIALHGDARRLRHAGVRLRRRRPPGPRGRRRARPPRRRRGAARAADDARGRAALVAELVPAGPLGERRSTSMPTRPPGSPTGTRSAPSCSRSSSTAAAAEDDPTSPTLWPEHFDIAIELGDEVRRAPTTASRPATSDHAEPYAYVGPWTAPRSPASCGTRPASAAPS